MTIRMSGLSSGLDTESIIKDLMKVETMKVDQFRQKKQLTEWKRDDYREINTKLLALRNAAFDMKLQGSFQTKKVSASDDTVLTASAGAAVPEGYNSITVHNLATGVYKGSTASLNSTADRTSLKTQFGGSLADTITFTLEGYDGEKVVSKEFSFDTATQSISDVISTINDADIGIKASYDSGVDRFFLTTTGTGSNYKIHSKADAQGFLTGTMKLGLTVGADVVAADQGKDALVDFNGVTGLNFATNQFTLNNISFNLKKAGTVQLNVTNDVDATVDKIKAFVEAYNNTMDLIATQTSEKRYRDFKPLMDEQKKDMEESDIKLWEDKAKSGLLQGDSLLTGVYSQTRSAATGNVSGLTSGSKYTNLSAIGITTGAWNDNGKLYIDEDKLKKALADDTEGVMNLFTQKQISSTTTDTRGIAVRMYDQVKSAISTITEKAGSDSGYFDSSTMGKTITDYDDRIDDMVDRLADIEDRYYKQFTAMEKALERMNSQSQWLTQQFSGSSS